MSSQDARDNFYVSQNTYTTNAERVSVHECTNGVNLVLSEKGLCRTFDSQYAKFRAGFNCFYAGLNQTRPLKHLENTPRKPTFNENIDRSQVFWVGTRTCQIPSLHPSHFHSSSPFRSFHYELFMINMKQDTMRKCYSSVNIEI